VDDTSGGQDRALAGTVSRRHSTGFKLANDGKDTRAIQLYLGHKNIQHTVRYTVLSSDRLKEFWND
jgi:type 1 fimbriae regulatory protein FimB/type 1 fimbriae regulatory protein FimE